MYIIGIDPGYDRCGFSVLESRENRPHICTSGVITTNREDSFQDRLFELGQDIENLFQKYPPTIVAIEDLFWGTNQTTGMLVSQVRGVLVYLARKYGARVIEPKPVEIKKAFTGNGKATKDEMKKMVSLVFERDVSDILDDTIDAIALGYCSAQDAF